MPNRLKSRWVLGGVVALVLLSAACVQLAPMARSRFVEPPAPDNLQTFVLPPVAIDAGPASASVQTTGGRGTSVVRRGPISDVASLTGRVAGVEEIGLELSAGGRIQTVAVRADRRSSRGRYSSKPTRVIWRRTWPQHAAASKPGSCASHRRRRKGNRGEKKMAGEPRWTRFAARAA